MLSLFEYKVKLLHKKPTKTFLKEKKISKNQTTKHYPSPIREWYNSIYVFNKNSLKLIPSLTTLSNDFIRKYFDLYNKRLEQKIRTKKLSLRLRKLSSNKFYISNGGFKHTNNKVFINLYVFNRQKNNFLLILKKWYLKNFLMHSLSKKDENKSADIMQKNRKNLNLNLFNRIKIISDKGIQAAISVSKNKYLLIKALNTIKQDKVYNLNKFKTINQYTKNFYSKLIKKSLKKIRMYFYYKQLLHINKSKLNYTYLQYLKKFMEKIYKKNVEFNIINLKKFYLNSDILSQSITNKITKNRRKIFLQLNKFNSKIKIQNKKLLLQVNPTNSMSFYNSIFSDRKKALEYNKLFGKENIINNLKYKDITGYRLEIKGRITKRHTAARSAYRFKHKGAISDIDSSYKGLSSVLLKGNLKSNTQYTHLKSKTRIGSFGIKGWVSGN